MKKPESIKGRSLKKIVWTAGSILALIIGLMLFVHSTSHLLLLILVGALVACYFRGLGGFIASKTKLNKHASLVTSILGTFLLAIGFFYLVGATISSQISDLEKAFPDIVKDIKEALENSDVGKEIISQAKGIDSSQVKEFFSGFFTSTFGIFGDLYVILLLGLYFTSSPQLYKNLILEIIHPKSRDQAKEVINHVSGDLTKWLLGKFIAMALVFVVTAIALAIIGLPMWLALSFITGLLVFIPNFGPIIAMIPVLAVAFSESVTTFWIVALIFAIIQISEGSFITPKLQNRLINVPPALII